MLVITRITCRSERERLWYVSFIRKEEVKIELTEEELPVIRFFERTKKAVSIDERTRRRCFGDRI